MPPAGGARSILDLAPFIQQAIAAMDLQRKLKALEGQIVRLSFADGEEIEARLAAVDVEDHEDIIYSVLRVLRPSSNSEYDSSSLYRSTIDTIVDVSSIIPDSTSNCAFPQVSS
jgi:hypothetical protein